MSEAKESISAILEHFLRILPADSAFGELTQECLHCSVILCELLKQRGVQAQIITGFTLVETNEFVAHYWVRADKDYDIRRLFGLARISVLAKAVKQVSDAKEKAICLAMLKSKMAQLDGGKLWKNVEHVPDDAKRAASDKQFKEMTAAFATYQADGLRGYCAAVPGARIVENALYALDCRIGNEVSQERSDTRSRGNAPA
jgi:hypothetical protein